MTTQRRDFLKQLLATTAAPGLLARPTVFGALFDQESAKQLNPEFDPQAFDFWSGFTARDGKAAIVGSAKTRGPRAEPSQPVFLHHGTEGFRNAAQLDRDKLIERGDVTVSVNTSVVKVGDGDQKTFQRLQNAQLRVDLAQKTSIIPTIEAMAYTLVGAMQSVEGKPLMAKVTPPPKGTPASAVKKPVAATVQSVTIASDATWQKMQNIPLPGGEGRWALNLEAQKKDSLFCKVLQNLVKEGGMFAPMLGLPGIAMSALNSFNTLYGALHAVPVPIIKSNPVRVFATQEAMDSTGESASDIGAILLQPGTYILMPAGQAPGDDQWSKLALVQDRIVSTSDAKLTGDDLDLAAANLDALKNVTYVTFDVQVKRTTLLGESGKG